MNKDFDLIMLPETHCTARLQKSLGYKAADFKMVWGAPVPSKSRSGVAFVARRSVVWDIQKVNLTGTPCQQYYNDSRFIVAQVYLGNGDRPLLRYGVYGHAGARWEPARKQELHDMLQCIFQDAASRGPHG